MVSNQQLKSISMRNLRTKQSVFNMLFEYDPTIMDQQQQKPSSVDPPTVTTTTTTTTTTTIDVTVDIHTDAIIDNITNADHDDDKMRTARRSLHRYIFVVCHTMQHFGHHLTANEMDLVQAACEKTLRWMWRSKPEKTLEAYQQRIKLMMQICAPFMNRVFRAEQRQAQA